MTSKVDPGGSVQPPREGGVSRSRPSGREARVDSAARAAVDRMADTSVGPIGRFRGRVLALMKDIFFSALEEKVTGGEAYSEEIRRQRTALLDLPLVNRATSVEDIDLRVHGKKLDGMLLRPKNPQVPEKVVIFAPGNDTTVFSFNYQYVAEAYLSRGISVLFFDYSQIGLSEGVFSTSQSYLDIEAVYQNLKTRGFEDAQVMVEGYSYGSCPALSLGAHHPGIQVVLRCPMSSPSDAAEGVLREQGRSGPIISIARQVTRLAMPASNKEWARRIPVGHLHIMYGNDHLEQNGVNSAAKLLAAHLRRDPDPEQRARFTKHTDAGHFARYLPKPEPGVERGPDGVTTAFDQILSDIHWASP